MNAESARKDVFFEEDGVLKRHAARTFHVCRTGSKQQFYTLYGEAVNWSDYGVSHNVWFVQNLAHKLEDAMAKAESFADEVRPHIYKAEYNVTVEYHDSPRPLYVKHEAFGVEMQLSRNRKTWWAGANSEFWDNWRAKKQHIKDAGYWVKKMNYDWLVFKQAHDLEVEYDDLSFLHGGEEE